MSKGFTSSISSENSFDTGDCSSDSPPLVGVPQCSDPDNVSQSSSPPKVVDVAGRGLMGSAGFALRYLSKNVKATLLSSPTNFSIVANFSPINELALVKILIILVWPSVKVQMEG
uniref:Uncharacterized protein n=1 Tax=Cacopsylla melanoneura TaxID=428564 RepID=A0A8D9A656_9HEMI